MDNVQFSKWSSILEPDVFNKTAHRMLDVAIHSVTIQSFAEMGLAFVLTFAVGTFVAQPLSAALFSGLLFILTLESGLRLATYGVRKFRCKLEGNENSIFRKAFLGDVRQCSRETIVNLFATAGPSIAIHEAGHALTALAVYNGSKPSITILPWRGGATRLNMAAPLSYLGRVLGRTVSVSLVIAGGVIATTVTATVLMMVAYRLKESNPHVSEFLNLFAFAQLINDLVYGLMSIPPSPANASSDFTRLYAVAGIHPIATMAMMVAVPVVMKFVQQKYIPLGYTTRGCVELHSEV